MIGYVSAVQIRDAGLGKEEVRCKKEEGRCQRQCEREEVREKMLEGRGWIPTPRHRWGRLCAGMTNRAKGVRSRGHMKDGGWRAAVRSRMGESRSTESDRA